MIKLVETKEIDITEDYSIIKDEDSYSVISTRDCYATTYFETAGSKVKEFLERISDDKLAEYNIQIRKLKNK